MQEIKNISRLNVSEQPVFIGERMRGWTKEIPRLIIIFIVNSSYLAGCYVVIIGYKELMSVFERGELPTFSGEIGPEERRAGAL